ncbi:Structural maintenance of chromosomes protein 1 [Cytospora mali]|uniref:Structural maintenance of chromosomes protein n=1 Tax=Cytospora mali TaxID=578113 RepID=A0A194V4T5_CYTMA|nr:Structural maintenance of chromosomes protein 1 [Valsa mali var. pyri (nom. inval.)]
MGKLIRLELYNFKSYKGHHTLLFGDSYFTSIIGPNGSGKSNSMDAISFVLGIKSSQLRSSHLKELVYRGRVMKTSKINDDGSVLEPSTNGHTNGHANDDEDASQRGSRNDPKTAWVMAVYEDDAGDEQKWKRTITPQGSSTYHINDRVVTAQQYNEALEAENILIKARNFLVFQGDVEAIASQSPQDLTRLVEQISGSLEYKAEYDRLQTEVEQAAENQNFQLHRRRGINSEIKQYQEQKKEAENFQKKTEERDEAVVTHILWKLYNFQKVMDESSAQIQEHQQNLIEFRRNVEAFEKKLEGARREYATVGREVSKIEKNIRAKERDIEEKENSLVPINAKVAQSGTDIERLKKRAEAVSKERDEQAKAIQKAKKDLATVEKAQQEFEKQWQETIKKQGKQLTDADRKEYNNLRAQTMAKSSQNQAKLDSLIRQLKGDEVTVNSLKGKVDTFQAAVEKLDGELHTIQERKEATHDLVQQISTEIEGKKKDYNQLVSERVRITNSTTELEEKMEDLGKKIREAEDGKAETDRERRTKEMVQSLKRMNPGVRGRVGELCKPKQKKFDEAVITALGRDFDSVIVDTEKIGLDCVEYLKQQRFSPMTFIPLDNIKTNAPNSAVKGIPGARLTIETIDFDQSYERAMTYACGSSVVCDSLDVAKDICYKRRIPVKAVTLEGYVIHKAGLMTGGRLPERKGGKRQFQEHDVQNLYKQLEKEETLRQGISSLEQRLKGARFELQAFEKNEASKKKELQHEKRQLDEWEPKYEEKNGELEATRKAVAKFEGAIAAVQDKIFADFCKRLGYADIRTYEAMQGSLEQEASKKRNEFEVQKQKLKSMLTLETSRHDETQRRVQQIKLSLERLEADIESYEGEKAAIEEALGANQDELEALQESLEEVKEEQNKKAEKVSEAKQDVQKRSKDIDSRLKAISALEAEIQKNSASRFALLRRCKLEQVQIPLVEGSLDDLPNEDNLLRQDPDAMDVDEGDEDDAMEAAMDDHGIEVDYDSLDEELKNTDDDVEEKLQERISSLTAELEKLNPNMRAIERLESVENRLKATEQDFENSRTALKEARDAFNAIKAQRFDLFNKAFEHIKEQIVAVYKDLTRSEAFPIGGHAYLDIEDDTDTPYLSGIKYHAMPPLKRFRDMEHLSGGEKTIAALALLFAIHSYQPSPFFVLDEVDAALDNANVEKIKKYIREHAGPGMQFIVISLKTGLFQDSESLVGVYRDQEVNSSKTLTLDLRKYA